MNPADDVLAAFVKRAEFGPEPAEKEAWTNPDKYDHWHSALEGYRAGHADCAAQGAKDMEDAISELTAIDTKLAVGMKLINSLHYTVHSIIAARKATK